MQARLSTEQLIPALNEQLKERYAGNDFYKAKDFQKVRVALSRHQDKPSHSCHHHISDGSRRTPAAGDAPLREGPLGAGCDRGREQRGPGERAFSRRHASTADDDRLLSPTMRHHALTDGARLRIRLYMHICLQEEIEKNRVCVLLNLAAGHVALKEFGAAAKRCTEALALDPQNIKALLRRAKAYTGRREYEARRLW